MVCEPCRRLADLSSAGMEEIFASAAALALEEGRPYQYALMNAGKESLVMRIPSQLAELKALVTLEFLLRKELDRVAGGTAMCCTASSAQTSNCQPSSGW